MYPGARIRGRENLNTCSFLPEGVYYNVLTARLVNSDPLVRTGYWQLLR